MAKQFQKDLTSSELKTAMKEGRRLSSLSPRTKAWIQGRLLEDTSIKPKTKVEKAADSMTKTSGGLINWVKKNPVETALLFAGGTGLVRGASKFIIKKFGKKALNKIKEGGFKKDIKDILKKDKVKESVISKKPEKSGVDKLKISKKPERSGVDKLKIAEQKVNNSKLIKNSDLSFDDKQKVIQEMAKGSDKTLAAAFTKVLRGNGKGKSVISKKTKEDKTDKFIKKQREKNNKTKSNNKVKTETKPKGYTVKETMKILEKKKVVKPTTTKITQADKDKQIRQIVKNAINQVGNKTVVERGKAVQFIETTMRKAKASKSDIDKAVKQYRNTLVMSKKGGLIKKNIGGTVLKDIPAGNKGLPNLPTNVRNNMGYKKKGGVIKRNKGGFLGAGKALRGQGAVMRKKGGKIAY